MKYLTFNSKLFCCCNFDKAFDYTIIQIKHLIYKAFESNYFDDKIILS